jgi:hypothetical protein
MSDMERYINYTQPHIRTTPLPRGRGSSDAARPGDSLAPDVASEYLPVQVYAPNQKAKPLLGGSARKALGALEWERAPEGVGQPMDSSSEHNVPDWRHLGELRDPGRTRMVATSRLAAVQCCRAQGLGIT